MNQPRHDASATLHINWTRCDGRGACVELLPELLARDDWGYPLTTTGDTAARSNITVPAQLIAAAVDAVNLCPVLALTLTRRS